MAAGDAPGLDSVLGKALAVLRAFGPDDDRGIGFAELQRRTGLAKGTLHRVAGDLVAARLLDRDDGRYRLSVGLFELGMRASVERTLLEVAVPLWVVRHTEAPISVVALLFLVNTACCVLLQVRVSRAAVDVPSSARAVRRGGVLLAASCLVFASSGGRSAAVAVGLLVLATIAITTITNKTLSPQYLLWLGGPAAVLLLSRRTEGPARHRVLTRLAVQLLVLAALTQLTYPVLYNGLLGRGSTAFLVVSTVVTSLRNLSLLALTVEVCRYAWVALAPPRPEDAAEPS